MPQLEWQSELDSTMSEIDNRLTHPRRRSTDPPQPTFQGLNEMTLTSEIMDEIAWRVAEELRRRHEGGETAPTPPAQQRRSDVAPGSAQQRRSSDAPARSRVPLPPPVKPSFDDEPLRPGKMLMIRYRMPALPWPFSLLRRRRKQHPLTTAKVRV